MGPIVGASIRVTVSRVKLISINLIVAEARVLPSQPSRSSYHQAIYQVSRAQLQTFAMKMRAHCKGPSESFKVEFAKKTAEITAKEPKHQHQVMALYSEAVHVKNQVLRAVKPAASDDRSIVLNLIN